MLICSIALVNEETATDQVLLPGANKSNSPLVLPPSLMDVASCFLAPTGSPGNQHQLRNTCPPAILHHSTATQSFLSLVCETISTLQLIPLL